MVKPNLGKAVAGGFVGTVFLTLMMRFLAPMMTGQSMNMPETLGRMTGMGPVAGLIMHFFTGSVIFPVIYVFVFFPFLPGAPWLKGLMSGVLFWLGLEVVMLPMIGGGFFSSEKGGAPMVVAALIAHLVYGVTLGAIAGAPELRHA